MRILLVDDNDDLRLLVRTHLEFSSEHEVVGEAGTFTQALEEAGRLQPEVVVTDLVMAGRESAGPMLAALRGAAPGARILIFSGWDAPDFHGADGFVLKSGDLGELIDAIDILAS